MADQKYPEQKGLLVNSYSLLEYIQFLQERLHTIITYFYYCSCHYRIGEDIPSCI